MFGVAAATLPALDGTHAECSSTQGGGGGDGGGEVSSCAISSARASRAPGSTSSSLAALASAALKEDAKDRQIAELQQRVREQATTIALLKQGLARAQAALAGTCEQASTMLGDWRSLGFWNPLNQL